MIFTEDNARKVFTLPVFPQGRESQASRQSRPRQAPSRARLSSRFLTTCVLGGALALAGCGDPAHDLKVGTVGYVSGFAGSVTASEPRAVLVGRDVLSAGGSAADAAVAVAFTLAATLPSSAGVGAGGVCLVHDHASKKTRTLDFLPPPASASVIGAASDARGTPVAIPTMPRAMYALFADYGRLRWEQLLGPAEQIARFGEPVSRALAQELRSTGQRIARDPYARGILSSDGGTHAIQEGDILKQVDLATVIGRLRQKGPGALYGGSLGRQYADAVAQLGGLITVPALRAYAPSWTDTQSVSVGNETLHFPAKGLSGGEALQPWTSGQAATIGANDQAPGVGATGFVVVDPQGSAVSCALTMNGPFGAGFMAPGTGMFLVAPAPQTGQSRMPVSVALLMNHYVNEFRLGVAVGGGGAVADALHMTQAITSSDDTKTLPDAAKMVADAPAGPGLVNAISCPEGLPSHPGSCSVSADPRGNGYGLLVGKKKE